MRHLLRRPGRIIGRMTAFLSLQPETRRLLVEAYLFLAWGRVLKSLPFAKVAPRLGTYMAETSQVDSSQEENSLKRISSAIQFMSKYTFWESQCLVQAIAAMHMLNRRKIDSTLYLGIAKEKQGDLAAHAWLRSGSRIVTGAEVMDQFTVVAFFGKHHDPVDQRGKKHERVS